MKGLTVAELIEELSKLPQNAKVVQLYDSHIASEYTEIGGAQVIRATLSKTEEDCCSEGHWCGCCHNSHAEDVVVLRYGNSLVEWEDEDG